MSPFEFFGVGRIVFGRGQFARVGEFVAPLGRAALVVYNGDEQGRGGALDRLDAALVSLIAGYHVWLATLS